MIIPNSFQTPNLYIDRAMPYLTDSELRCLIYATRHILGWQDRIGRRRGKLSLSMFEHGFTTKDGTYYAGCGLSRQAIIAALKTLVENGLLIRIGEADEHGQEWELGSTDIQWDKLEQRQNKTIDAFKARTIKARERMAEKRLGGMSDIPVLLNNTTPGMSDNTRGGMSDNTQSKPSSKPSSKQGDTRKSASTPKLPKSRNQWKQDHLTSYEDAFPEIKRLAALDNALEPSLSQLTRLTALDCVALFEELQRFPAVDYKKLFDYAAKRDNPKGYNTFKWMLYSLDSFIKTPASKSKEYAAPYHKPIEAIDTSNAIPMPADAIAAMQKLKDQMYVKDGYHATKTTD